MWPRIYLRDRKPTRTGALQPARSDQVREQRPLDGPAEPLPHFVLVREDRGANADQHELRERLLLVRFPRLVPRLVPAHVIARVAMITFHVVYIDVSRSDLLARIESLVHLAALSRL